MPGDNALVVPPFDCTWLMGDVAFEARADNDVTVVFKEHPGYS
jgi:hypothetical protein